MVSDVAIHIGIDKIRPRPGHPRQRGGELLPISRAADVEERELKGPRVGGAEAVSRPATAQAFEPGWISLPVRGGNRKPTFAASPRASMLRLITSSRQVVVRMRNM